MLALNGLSKTNLLHWRQMSGVEPTMAVLEWVLSVTQVSFYSVTPSYSSQLRMGAGGDDGFGCDEYDGMTPCCETLVPSRAPTTEPTTDSPTATPTNSPTHKPTVSPTSSPTPSPTDNDDSNQKRSKDEFSSPTEAPTHPTYSPTNEPTQNTVQELNNDGTNAPSPAPTEADELIATRVITERF